MKQIILFVTLFLTAPFAFGQNEGPKEITPQILAKLKAEIEKQVPAFKQQISKKELSKDEIEFAIDTFRIAQLVSKRIDIDYSTVGMNTTVYEMGQAYDQLMNKYYNRLLKALQPEDKKVLIAAQKVWLAYRDAEEKLIGTMTKEEYSGGGTIQSNIATSAYADLIVQRANEIFSYYDSIIKDK